jgi:urease accessory protein
MRSLNPEAVAGIAPTAAAAAQHQRVDGEARMEFRSAPHASAALADLYQRAPCRVLFPIAEAGDPLQAVVLTTSGGLTGGDRVRVAVTVGEHARATVTTQAAEKLYRSLPALAPARVEMQWTVGEHAWAECLAQETILFDGARLHRTLFADVAQSGRLLALESLVFGRTAMGERFDYGFVHDVWRVRRAGRLIWADALHLDGDIRHLRQLPFGFGTAVACSTLLYVGPDSAQQLGEVRKMIGDCAVQGGATAFDGMLIVRLLAADATALRAAVMTLAAGIRCLAAGLPARMPRVWYC